MKLLGHAWVAVNAKPEGNEKLLILGSILPEIMYYTKDHPFEFEEIHEGGDVIYKYLRRNKPELADLGLGMLAHSVKIGADKFNVDENLAMLGYEGKKVGMLRKRLSDILGISNKTAKTRAHNILELAVELRIIREHPEFVEVFNETVADGRLRESVVETLSTCFQKPKEKVEKSVDELLDKARPKYFRSSEGLASLWSELSREFDPKPDVKRLAGLLEELSVEFGDRDKEFLSKCISWTKSNIGEISSQPKE